MVSVYALVDPITQEPRYVGITERQPATRLREHLYYALTSRKHSHKNNWIRLLNSNGQTPTITVLETVTYDDYTTAESKWIAEFKALGYKLTNGTEGGEFATFGSRMTEASKALMRANRPDMTGDKNPMYGRKQSDKNKAVVSALHKGKFGALNSRAKKLEQYTPDGELVKVWPCAKDACDALGLSRGNVSAAAIYNTNKAADQPYKLRGGYVFKFPNENV